MEYDRSANEYDNEYIMTENQVKLANMIDVVDGPEELQLVQWSSGSNFGGKKRRILDLDGDGIED